MAGIIEYGDELNYTKNISLPRSRLFDATVYPDAKKETIYADELVEHIRKPLKETMILKFGIYH